MRTSLTILLWMMVALARAAGATFSESFSTEPVAWTAWNGGAFRWDAEAKNLAVTWDSREPNAFFYYKLPTEITRRDSFAVEFTLRLDDLQLGINPAKAYTFQVCVGFLNLKEALRANYYRGSGVNTTTGARSLVEFTYFPASGPIEATVGTVMVSTNTQFSYAHSFPVELTVGDIFRVKMEFDPASQKLATTLLRNGEPYGEAPDNQIETLTYPAGNGDFHCDVFSITSYNDAAQSPPQFAGSILAHGIVDDVVITTPDAPVSEVSGRFEDGRWVVEFMGKAAWSYQLERTEDLLGWEVVDDGPGADGTIELVDESPSISKAFYRVVARR